MKEIEVKILEINKEAIIAKLESWGAKKVFDGEMEAVFFDHKDMRLQKEGKLLRIRQKLAKTELTLKKNITKDKAKSADEINLAVDDHEAAEAILREIGLDVYRKVKKHRISYRLGEVVFEIDTLPGIPPLLEIEAPDTKTIEEYVIKLGYSMRDTRPWDTWDVLKHYKK